MSSLEEMLQDTPTLTFEPFPEEQKEIVVEEKKEAVETMEIPLTEEEKKMVEQFSKQIDIGNSNQILQYGAGAQKKMANFSETALEHVKSKDLGEIGKMLSDVVVELKNFDVDEEEKGGLFGLFKKTSNRINNLKAKYAKSRN